MAFSYALETAHEAASHALLSRVEQRIARAATLQLPQQEAAA